jgi:hypothetical protein
MKAMETRTTQVSFFGRLVDDLTRAVILPPGIDASLQMDGTASLTKGDGYFVFTDLTPSASDYRISLAAPAYQPRIVTKTLSATPPVELTFPGEDEMYLAIADVTAAQSSVTFDEIAFVPPIRAGAAVVGQGGFTATLVEALEGSGIKVATLSGVAALAANQLIRIVRSRNLVMRPGPYYAFAGDATILALKVVGDDQSASAVDDARIDISKINAGAPNSIDVGGLNLNVFDLGAGPHSGLVLDDEDKTTTTNQRGDAVLYFAGGKPITSLELKVSKSGFQSVTQTVNVTAKARNAQTIVLARA